MYNTYGFFYLLNFKRDVSLPSPGRFRYCFQSNSVVSVWNYRSVNREYLVNIHDFFCLIVLVSGGVLLFKMMLVYPMGNIRSNRESEYYRYYKAHQFVIHRPHGLRYFL